VFAIIGGASLDLDDVFNFGALDGKEAILVDVALSYTIRSNGNPELLRRIDGVHPVKVLR